MIKAIDHVIVAVSDLRVAEKDYIQLLGSEPVWRGSHPNLGTSNVLFNFENTYLELLANSSKYVFSKLKSTFEVPRFG